jgi:hypothetical protein
LSIIGLCFVCFSSAFPLPSLPPLFSPSHCPAVFRPLGSTEPTRVLEIGREVDEAHLLGPSWTAPQKGQCKINRGMDEALQCISWNRSTNRRHTKLINHCLGTVTVVCSPRTISCNRRDCRYLVCPDDNVLRLAVTEITGDLSAEKTAKFTKEMSSCCA